MSHFSVLVIGDDVEGQLAPYHEFECTGTDDQYIQNVDELEEARETYARQQTRPDATRETFAEFCAGWYGSAPVTGERPDFTGEHKYGWMRVAPDGDVIELVKRTNPNAKWDWWIVGGRWTGYLQLKPGRLGSLGEIGVPEKFATHEERVALAIERTTKADCARKGDVDFEAMRYQAGMKAGAKWDKINAVIAGRSVDAWATVRDAHPNDIEAARVAYREQPVVHDLNTSSDDDLRWTSHDGLEKWLVSREQCVQSARDGACATFAVVKDGRWQEKGEMGWFACVSNEKDAGAWQREFAAVLDALPDDTMLTVVDCHI